jgi:hypothetical protein
VAELPSYTDGDVADGETVEVRRIAKPVARFVARTVDGGSERIGQRATRVHGREHAPSIDLGERSESLLVTRWLFADADDAAAAFDRWRSAAHRRLRSLPGTLVLLDGGRARLILRTSVLPIPMRLEIAEAGVQRIALHLRPQRRLIRTIGWHRRGAYYAAGNVLLDRIHREIAGDLARRGAWRAEPLTPGD